MRLLSSLRFVIFAVLACTRLRLVFPPAAPVLLAATILSPSRAPAHCVRMGIIPAWWVQTPTVLACPVLLAHTVGKEGELHVRHAQHVEKMQATAPHAPLVHTETKCLAAVMLGMKETGLHAPNVTTCHIN